MFKKILLFIFLVLIIGAGTLWYFVLADEEPPQTVVIHPRPELKLWKFQAIDTMKYSRDQAREHSHNPNFDKVIEGQVKDIAETGATHVAIATPYDEEFVPFLKRWVAAARKHDLKIWYRGNWSGWEGWFEYPRFTDFETHIQKTKEFIGKHPELFADGDVFSGCPECENGGPGDPRHLGNVERYRHFLIDEYRVTEDEFRRIGKKVSANYFSMNADVARLVMDKETTTALDGIVTIDHYVKTPEQLANDAQDIAEQSGGKIILGEFGAPIPDIHGSMSETVQAEWLREVLGRLAQTPEVIGMSYWLSVGGSTEIWNDRGKAHPAAGELKRYYEPRILFGVVRDELGQPIAGATVRVVNFKTVTRENGYFELPFVGDEPRAFVSASDFIDQMVNIPAVETQVNVTLVTEHKSWSFKLEEWWQELHE